MGGKAAMTNKEIHMNNYFIQHASYRLTSTQMNIWMYLLSNIGLLDEPDKELSLSVREYCDIYGIKEKNTTQYRKYLLDAITAMDNKQIVIHHDDGTETIAKWFSSIETADNGYTIKVVFHKSVAKYFYPLVWHAIRLKEMLGIEVEGIDYQ